MSTISGIDYLGRCFNIFDLDPLNMGATAKGPRALRLGAETYRQEGHEVPLGVNLRSPYATEVRTTEEIIYNSLDFESELSRSLEVEAGFEGEGCSGKFGASKSFKEIVQLTQSRKQIFKYCIITVQNHMAELEDLSKAAVTDEFARAVRALPADGAGDAARKAYEGLIEKFGTHFAAQLSIGGLAYQRISTTVNAYKSSSEVQKSFGANASIEIKIFSAGTKSTEAEKQARTLDSENEMTRTALSFRGGTGSRYEVIDGWFSDLHERAVPIPLGCRMRRLSELLSPGFFPDVPAIDAKRVRLNQELSRYFDERGGELGVELRYGDRVQITGSTYILHASPQHRVVLLKSMHNTSGLPRATIVLRDPDDPQRYGEPIFTSQDYRQSSAVNFWVEELGGYLTMPQLTDAQKQSDTPEVTFGPVTDDPSPRSRWVVRSPADALAGRPASRRPIVSGDDLIFGRLDDETKRYFVIQTVVSRDYQLSIGRAVSEPLYGSAQGVPTSYTLAKLTTKL